MNIKRFIIASIIVFIVYQICNTLIHMFLLSGIYMQTEEVWRTDMNQVMWIMWVNDFIRAFLFVLIFIKGYEGKGWAEGLRYGILMGVFLQLSMSLGMYTTLPIPFTLAIYWFVLGLIQIILMGITAALIYKPKTA